MALRVEHRADALFALPRLPRSAALLGDPPGWRRDLGERGIEIVGPGGAADVVVATEQYAGDAVASGADSVIVDGSRHAATAVAGAGFRTAQLLSLPLSGTPVLFVDVRARRAARYALRRGIVHRQLWRTLRNEVVAALVGAGARPPFPTAVAVGSRNGGPPAFLSAARELGVPTDGGWVMLISPGSVVRRNGLLVFPPGMSQPSHVVKFARVASRSPTFEREARGVARVAAAGGAVAARAPTHLGQIEVDGFPAAVETAARGTKLSAYLRRPLPRSVKIRALDAVAEWLVQVAGETQSAPQTVVSAEGLSVPPVPLTFQHNDLAEENVIVRRGGFTVLDWEWADPAGLPLGDLVYFAVQALRVVDDAGEEQIDRERHFVDLARGRAPGSSVFFRWVRSLASALGLPRESVGPLVTLSWLRRAETSRDERERAQAVGGAPLEPAYAERVARLWVETDGLGPKWTAWLAER